MDKLEQLSLRQLQELLYGDSQDGESDENDALIGNYISQNLGIASEQMSDIIVSRLTDSPTLMPEMRIIIIRRGWIEGEINFTPCRFEAGTLLFVGPDSIAQIERASDDLSDFALSMSSDLFTIATAGRVPKAFDGHLRDFSLQLSPGDADFLAHLHQLIYQNTRRQVLDSQVTLHLISSFLWFVSQLWSQHEAVTLHSMTREQRLFSEFIQMVNRDVRQQHQVEYYASRFCMVSRYFSSVIHRVSGKPPKAWIDDALLTQAKIALKYSEKTVVQIADDLQFPSPSLFCKFFKRLTGASPLEYRGM